MAASVGQRPYGLVVRATHRLDAETHTRVPHEVGARGARDPAWAGSGIAAVLGCGGVCLQLRGCGGGGDTAEARWFRDPEGAVQDALGGGQLAGLGEFAVV